MNWITLFGALGLATVLAGGAAEAGAADPVGTALQAIRDAKALAGAGRGGILLVGAVLATPPALHENAIAIVEYPALQELPPGSVLLLAKPGCEARADCLIARRLTEIDDAGQVRTDPYNADELLFGEVQANLVGSVSYTVDLDTGHIRDMRAGHGQELITLSEALARERERNRLAALSRN